MKYLFLLATGLLFLSACSNTETLDYGGMDEKSFPVTLTPFSTDTAFYNYGNVVEISLNEMINDVFRTELEGREIEDYNVNAFEVTGFSLTPTSTSFSMETIDSVLVNVGDIYRNELIELYKSEYTGSGLNFPFPGTLDQLTVEKNELLASDILRLYQNLGEIKVYVVLIPKPSAREAQGLKFTIRFRHDLSIEYSEG